MTSWPKPPAYLTAYKHANVSEWRRHLLWLEERGYPYLAQLRKEIDAKANKPAGSVLALSGAGSVSEKPDASGMAELEGEIPEMGDDLLA